MKYSVWSVICTVLFLVAHVSYSITNDTQLAVSALIFVVLAAEARILAELGGKKS